MQSLPKELHTTALTYTIVEEPRLKEEGDFARIRVTEAVIEVATPMHPDVAAVHVIHEGLHALLIEAGILPPHDEQVVGALAHSLRPFVKRNPELFE